MHGRAQDQQELLDAESVVGPFDDARLRVRLKGWATQSVVRVRIFANPFLLGVAGRRDRCGDGVGGRSADAARPCVLGSNRAGEVHLRCKAAIDWSLTGKGTS